MVAIRKPEKKTGSKRAPVSEISASEIKDAMPHSKAVSFAVGTTIFREGAASEDCWLITKGRVEVRKKTRSGENVALASVKAGEFLGEMAMISGARRSASAVALTKVEAMLILYSDFETLMASRHPFAARLSMRFSLLLAERCNGLLKLLARQKKIATPRGVKKPSSALDVRQVLNRVYTLWAV